MPPCLTRPPRTLRVLLLAAVFATASTCSTCDRAHDEVPEYDRAFCNPTAPIAALFLAHSRTAVLYRTLKSFLKALQPLEEPGNNVAVYVSVDNSPRVTRVTSTAELAGVAPACIWRHSPVTPLKQATSSRQRIAAHYHFAINRVFATASAETASTRRHRYVVVLEDDLLFAPDFASYMFSFLPVLYGGEVRDGTELAQNRIVCISAWNDNGSSPASCDQRRYSFTSYFPGLGWAFSRSFWNEHLRTSWPGVSDDFVGIGWDYWLRIHFEENGWVCISPDVPRVFHAGTAGVNVNAAETASRFAASTLADCAHGAVNWTRAASWHAGQNLTNAADAFLLDVLTSATVIPSLELLSHPVITTLDCSAPPPSGHGAPLSASMVDPIYSFCDGAGTYSRFVVPYLREDFASQIAPSPLLRLQPAVVRGHYKHILTFHLSNRTVLHLVDARRGLSILPPRLRTALPPPTYVLPGTPSAASVSPPAPARFLSPAARGESCTSFCARTGRALRVPVACSPGAMEWANRCDALRAQFGCGRCAFETGADLPAYVLHEAHRRLETAGACLVAESGTESGWLDCDGRYKWTRRLCACEVLGVGGEDGMLRRGHLVASRSDSVCPAAWRRLLRYASGT